MYFVVLWPTPGAIQGKEGIKFCNLATFTGDHALNVFLASGPYTPSDNLDYAPLSDLLAAGDMTFGPGILFLAGISNLIPNFQL